MNNELLREYLRLIINEIRGNFNFEQFKELTTLEEMTEYASKFLKKIGEGSTREAYIFSQKKVIKIAKDDKGITQNETEAKISKDEGIKNIVAKVFEEDPQHKWITSEIVDPLENIDAENTFENISGISWVTFAGTIYPIIRYKKYDQVDQIKNQFIKDVTIAIITHNLHISDILRVDHWGKTSDGRLVLLDYGFTGDV